MPERPPTLRLVGAFAAVYLIWGSTYLGMKVAVRSIDPIPLGAVRFTLAGAMLLGILAALGRVRRPWLRSWRHWRTAAVVGGLMLVAANALLAWALRDIPSGTGALVVAVTPLWLVLLDWAQRRSAAPGWRVVAGLLLGVGGVAVLAGVGSGGGAGAPTRAESIGIGLSLVSTFCWALGSILGRRMSQPEDVLVGASMQMIAGGVLMTILTAVGAPGARVAWSAVEPVAWLAIAYLAVAGSMIGFTAYVWLLRNTSAARAGTYAYVNPLVAVLLGWAILGETPSPRVLVAAPLILVGVVLLQLAPRRRAATTIATAGPSLTPRSTSPADDGR